MPEQYNYSLRDNLENPRKILLEKFSEIPLEIPREHPWHNSQENPLENPWGNPWAISCQNPLENPWELIHPIIIY